MNTKKLINPVTIIFHSSKNNAEESLKNQQAFLKQHADHLKRAKIINYTGSKHSNLDEVKHATQLVISKGKSKLAMIVNSPIPAKEWDRQYDMYIHFDLIGALDRATFYFMDSEGRLFKRVEDIDWKE